MDQPSCSVIIPTYNRARFLPRALRSALASGLESFEVLVVDDGSRDGTREVVAPFLDRVRYIRRENGGLPAARNTGIAESRGRYLAFLDDDDEYIPGAHQRMVEALDARPDVGVVFADVLVNDFQDTFERGHRRPVYDPLRQMPGEPIVEGIRALDPEGFLLFEMLTQNCVLAQSSVTRRAVLETAGLFDASFGNGYEEWEFFSRLAAQTRFAYLDAPCARIEKHDSNMSKKMELMIANAVRIRERFLGPPFRTSGELRARLRTLWKEAWFDWAMYAMRRDDLPEVRRRLRAYQREFGFDGRASGYVAMTYLPVAATRTLRRLKQLARGAD
jgi:GT2 family glycosyltransferase